MITYNKKKKQIKTQTLFQKKNVKSIALKDAVKFNSKAMNSFINYFPKCSKIPIR